MSQGILRKAREVMPSLHSPVSSASHQTCTGDNRGLRFVMPRFHSVAGRHQQEPERYAFGRALGPGVSPTAMPATSLGVNAKTGGPTCVMASKILTQIKQRPPLPPSTSPLTSTFRLFCAPKLRSAVLSQLTKPYLGFGVFSERREIERAMVRMVKQNRLLFRPFQQHL